MTEAMQVVVLVLVGAAGTCIVFASFYGLTLVVLFFVFQAPDVALSELVVSGIAYPLVLVVAIARVKAWKRRL